MKASDGKSYLTDTADSEIMLDIISSISNEFVHPFRLFFEKIEMTYPQNKIDFLNELDESEEIELPVDMYLTPTDIIIESLVAGAQVEDIFISVTYKTITIKGKRVISQEKEKYLTQEIYWGAFSRTINLPTEIQVDRVEALVSHGSLTVRLPKIDTLKNRIVKVKSV
jgi:HSP20 family protein